MLLPLWSVVALDARGGYDIWLDGRELWYIVLWFMAGACCSLSVRCKYLPSFPCSFLAVI